MSATVFRSLIVSLLLSAAGIALVIAMLGRPSDLLIVAHFPPLHGVLAILATVGSFVIGGARLTYLCRRTGVRLPLWRAVRTHILGVFSATVTPGGAGNTPAIALMLQHYGSGSGSAWATGVAVFRADAVFHAWGLPVALVVLYASGTIPRTGVYLAVGTVAVVSTLALAWLLQFKVHWLAPVARRLLRGPLLRFRRAGLRFVDDMLASDTIFASAPVGFQLGVQGYTVAGWVTLFSALFFLARGFDVPVGFAGALAIQMVVMATSVLAPTPGGSGFFELGVSYLLIAKGGGASVPVVTLLWRLLTFYSTFVLGPLLGGFVVAQRLQGGNTDRAE